MGIKNAIKDFIPPIILHRLVKKKIVKKYDSFEEALEDCDEGYENKELCNAVADKTVNYVKKISENSFTLVSPVLFLFSSFVESTKKLNKEEMTVLDLGGACGANYFELAKMIAGSIKIKWIIVETEQMIQSAENKKIKRLVKSPDELIFLDSIEKVNESIDFAYTSGTIQYTSRPYEILSSFLSLSAPFICFNRTMFSLGETDIITMQRSKLSSNGPGPLPESYQDHKISYPHTTLSYGKFLKIINSSYKIIWSFPEESGHWKMEGEQITGPSLFCQKITL